MAHSRSARLIIICIGMYIIAFSVLAIGRYDRYNATAYDLAFYDQVLWNTAHGRFMALSLIGPGGNNFMSHVEPILILLAPVKLLLPDVRWLLVIQTIALAVAAWLVYRIALRRTSRPPIAAVFAILYLLYPVIGWANKFDFHPLAFTPIFLLAAYDRYETGYYGWVSVWLLLTMACKEEMGLIVAMFGLYAALKDKHWRWGLLWTAAGGSWSLLSFLVIIPIAQAASASGVQGWAAERYSWFLKGNLADKIAYLTGPDTTIKTRFLIQLLTPLAFLPLLRLNVALIGAPTLALALLSTSLNQSGIYHQYMLPVVPFLFIAAIYALDPAQRGLSALLKRLHWYTRPGFTERLILIMMFAATIVNFLIFNPFWFVPREPYSPIFGWEPGASSAALEKVKALIPQEGCLIAANNIAAHYSNRIDLYVPRRFDPPDCRYVLLDLADHRFEPDGTRYACERLATGAYSVNFHESAVILLERNAPPAGRGLPDFCSIKTP